MANFTLSTVTPSGEVILTYFDGNNNQISGLTFDESTNLSIDTSTLTFSALKYHIVNGERVINLPITSLTYGSIIRVYERNHMTEFKIQSINYSFLPNNLQLQFTCLERFQAEATKIGVGYSIQADPTSADFLGAQSIDTWARKIIRETNLPWGYIDVDIANEKLIKQLASTDQLDMRDDLSKGDQWAEINDALINEFTNNPATLNATVSFECSNSNAFEALKTLGNENELILRVDYATHNIYFILQKNWWFKGYYFNPHINLQQLGLQGDGQNMVTVLNVTGPHDINDQEITLVPSIPGDFETYVSTSDWDNSIYYPGFFSDHSSDKTFSTLANLMPWFENKLIDTSFYNNKLITEQDAEYINNILNNDLRRVNVPLMLATRNYYHNTESWLMELNQKKIDVETSFGNMVSLLDGFINDLPIDNNQHFFVAVHKEKLLLLSLGPNMYAKIGARTILPYNSGWGGLLWSIVAALPQPVTIEYYDQNDTYLSSLIINTDTGANIIEYPPSYEAPDFSNTPIPVLDEFLNNELSVLNAAWRSINKNAYLLTTYWEGDNYLHETFYCRFRKVGVLTTDINNGLDITMDETIQVGSPYSSVDSTIFTPADITLLSSYFSSNSDKITRSRIIQECANIAAKMTEYWDAMRTAGLQQGCYLPPTWDCLDSIEYCLNESAWLTNVILPLKKSGGHYCINSNYGRTTTITDEKTPIWTYKYYDQQRDALYPLPTNLVEYYGLDNSRVVDSNTDNYYIKITDDFTDKYNIWYAKCKHHKLDTVSLYKTRLKYTEYQYTNGSFICGDCGIDTIALNFYFNVLSISDSCMYQYCEKIATACVEGTTMYQLQAEHDKIWKNLYLTYPGMFTESVYENKDASSSMDLYFAAKAQLATLNQPEFSYSLTGIDIYSRENKILLWDIMLGDQVRIDYLEDEKYQQIVDIALKEPLYVTGINHSLRDDGNYQFTVATHKATDTMVRRFAQLLTLGR